jgi:hypothetical protein
MASDEELVSYSVWTLLPNSNSMKIRQNIPNQIMLKALQ